MSGDFKVPSYESFYYSLTDFYTVVYIYESFIPIYTLFEEMGLPSYISKYVTGNK